MKSARAYIVAGLLATTLAGSLSPQALAENTDPPRRGDGISGRSVVAGLTSLLIWPGIGQAINDQRGRKVGWHAVAGLFPPYRFFSGYDALVDRQGGYIDGRI